MNEWGFMAHLFGHIGKNKPYAAFGKWKTIKFEQV